MLPMSAHIIPAEFEWQVVPDEDDEGWRAALTINGEVIFEGPPMPEAADALRQSIELFQRALTWTLVESVHSQSGAYIENENEDEDDPLAGYVWMAHWAEDLKQGDEFLFQPQRGEKVRGTIVRISPRKDPDQDMHSMSPVTLIGAMDDTIYLIWSCTDPECMGHHYGLPPRAPVWIGVPVETPNTSEEIPDAES